MSRVRISSSAPNKETPRGIGGFSCSLLKMKKMYLIPTPHWARPFERKIEPEFGDMEFQRVFVHYDKILSIVQMTVEAYINGDFFAVETEKEGFPARERLTGEYYVGSESFVAGRDDSYFGDWHYGFSLMARCLEHRSPPNQINQDYLGLEVHFIWQPNFGWFEFYGDVDQSAI